MRGVGPGTARRAMILHRLSALNALHVVLASASPRRREILRDVVGVECDIAPSAFAENLPHEDYDGAAAYARATAWMKAMDVYENWDANERGSEMPDIIISADTVVESADGTTMEKPADAASATAMLRALSRSESKVHTGVAIIGGKISKKTGKIYGKSFSETTRVEFAELKAEEIAAYVATKEPYDKAGGYGIQGPAAVFIRGIVGDYFNVMGLPAHAFARELESMIDDVVEHA